MNATVKSKMARRYNEEFKRQAVELVIHGGKTQRQVAGELDVSEYSLNLWKKQYLTRQPSAEINAQEHRERIDRDCAIPASKSHSGAEIPPHDNTAGRVHVFPSPHNKRALYFRAGTREV
jgi:transposase-like protein